ncbi:hypothetical protein BX661DRAFT_196090 [Kickxella alabastrina]|uniref:uncharacterized protein n=1 Tax=Kickxella alabastrina TaxID=61397 RepID=UPI0022205018|nr:uncharacterized protein BX661DRAFT_196090 [Kickxella alabastrina]KAI7834355.1 hypothetical protein BX661DRAFT_196090 [Kickxella alabastrina]
MPRLSAAQPSATSAVNTATTTTSINKKSETMDKLFSIVNPAGQQAQAFAQHDDRNPFILPSFADNFESWAYPETQQAVFEDWIATTTPPNTATGSPTLGQTAMLAASMSGIPFSPLASSAMSMSPILSSPSLNFSNSSSCSPYLSNDLAFSLASTLQNAPRIMSGSFSVADYAAVLFPDIAATLASLKRAFSEMDMQLPTANAQVNWTADFAGLFDAAPIADLACEPAAASSILLTTSSDPEAEELRKRRDTEFLASLPPQLALKRRRTSNMKQKEKILAELMCDVPAAVAVPAAPATKKAAPSATKKAAAAAAALVCVKAEVDAEIDADEAEDDDDNVDAAALKRKKNTDAARRSRMRKILRIETLEGRVSELETENTKLAQMVAALESEKAAMAQRMAQMENSQLSAAASFAL